MIVSTQECTSTCALPAPETRKLASDWSNLVSSGVQPRKNSSDWICIIRSNASHLPVRCSSHHSLLTSSISSRITLACGCSRTWLKKRVDFRPRSERYLPISLAHPRLCQDPPQVRGNPRFVKYSFVCGNCQGACSSFHGMPPEKRKATHGRVRGKNREIRLFS